MTLILRWTMPQPSLNLRWRGGTDELLEAVACNPAAPVAAIIGPRGADGAGGSGGVNWVDGEVPGGTQNGVNPAFALAHNPLWLALVWNGLVQVEGVDFNRVGAAITYLRPGPAADDIHTAFYTWE